MKVCNHRYGTWSTACNFRLTVSFTKSMNHANSKINKINLRKAYSYYKTVSTGFPCDTSTINNIRGECLLLLTCILVDLHPWISSQLTVDFNQPLKGHGFTYLMMAIYYLLSHGANPDLETNLCDIYKTAHSLGFNTRHQSEPLPINNVICY